MGNDTAIIGGVVALGVAIVGAIATMVGYLVRRNGHSSSVTPEQAEKMITAALAARDKEVERAGLLKQVGDLRNQLTALEEAHAAELEAAKAGMDELMRQRDELAAELKIWRADAESSRAALLEVEGQRAALLTTIAEQQGRIEALERENLGLRQQNGQGSQPDEL